ncbi:MAG: hypothetical protein ABI950_00645, partial [Solirubrobacteraceae bacterium]
MTGPMDAVLRRCGATMTERHGHAVAAHFGSAASEAAVCRRTVGLAERGDRVTLEVHGPPDAVDAALATLAVLGGDAWSVRTAPPSALVRCEWPNAEAIEAALTAVPGVSVRDRGDELVALCLVGPKAAAVLDAAGVGTARAPAVVVPEGPRCIEVLVAAAEGPVLWGRLLDAGRPCSIACVGVDAIEHLFVS